MSATRVGSLFSGYEGIGLALREVFGELEHAFVADVCKVNKDGTVGHHEPHRSPCSILAHRFPGVPNLGDVSAIDWTPWRGLIDILSAGFPCQDVSVAGNRAGLRDGTRTGLWSQVVRAITELQPRLVVLENVPGIFTASAAGDVEPCAFCLGDGSGEHSLRALDAVLADLASLGFDADWTVVSASGVGAAHKRERWFCAAYPAGEPWSFVTDANGEQLQGVGPLPRLGGGLSHAVICDACAAADAKDFGHERVGAARLGRAGSANDDHEPLMLLPTPAVRQPAEWGEYEPAIRRWEAVTRPAPEPTKPNAKGNPKLSDEFDEWLMGLPVAWISGVPGITWNEVLKACGNGVVPQQCAAGLRWLRVMASWEAVA